MLVGDAMANRCSIADVLFCSECAHSPIGQPDSGLIGAVVRLLEDDSPKVRARALGTVHNLSTDARSIGIIREEVGESGWGA